MMLDDLIFEIEFDQQILEKDCHPIKVSVSHGYFYIDFYKTCKKFYNLRYTTMPIRCLKNNFSALRALMEDDIDFWSPLPSNTDSLSESDQDFNMEI